jgi:hypothetical protein
VTGVQTCALPISVEALKKQYDELTSKKTIKSLIEQVDEAAKSLIDYNDLLQKSADIANIKSIPAILGNKDALIALTGTYNALKTAEEQNIADLEIIADYFNRILPGAIRLTKDEHDKLNEAFKRAGYDWVKGFGRVKNAIEDTTKALDKSQDKAEKKTDRLLEITGRFGDAIADAIEGQKSLAESLTGVFKGLIREIMRAIVQALILKAIKGGSMGWGEVFTQILGLEDPRMDMALAMRSYNSSLNAMASTAKRWTRDAYRYEKMGRGEGDGTLRPTFIVQVVSPVPGAFVKAIKQVPQSDLHLLNEDVLSKIEMICILPK